MCLGVNADHDVFVERALEVAAEAVQLARQRDVEGLDAVPGRRGKGAVTLLSETSLRF